MLKRLLVSVAAGLLPMIASAGIITFDDLAPNSAVTNQYAGLGATFGSGHFGVQVGLANGDPGNWGVDGTNGAYFLGFNGSPGYAQTVFWSADINGFSLDVSRTNGSATGDTFTLEGWQNGGLVNSVTISLSAINTWSTVNVSGVFDEIRWYGNGGGFHPYGVDNLVFSDTGRLPEPGSVSLAVVALLGGLAAARRRKAA